jgi:hypothetical protein
MLGRTHNLRVTQSWSIVTSPDATVAKELKVKFLINIGRHQDAKLSLELSTSRMTFPIGSVVSKKRNIEWGRKHLRKKVRWVAEATAGYTATKT